MVKKYTAIDLFSGCGGLTEGLKQAGFRVLGAVECERVAIETYKHNHKRTKVWPADIKKLPVTHVLKEPGIGKGDLDLLAGCPPCQGFSSMRTLNGKRSINDPRNDLIYDFLRFVRGLMPKVVMLENVPGLAQDQRFLEFKEKLISLGYKFTKSEVINASHYGVPQRRRRLILLASRKADIAYPDKSHELMTVRSAIQRLPKAGSSGDPLHDFPENRTEKVTSLIEKIPKDGGGRTDLSDEHQLRCHRNTDGFKDVYGRMAWDQPAPTITSGCFNPSKGRFLHPTENRNITLREAALLQTFPKNYYFSLSGGKTAAALMIGNALPPELIKRKAEKIANYLKIQY